MNEQIKRLLEQVGLGQLSEAEAEKQYFQLIEHEAKAESTVIRPLKMRTQPIYLQQEAGYCNRRIECISRIENPEFRLFIFLPFGFGNETLSHSWKNAFSNDENVEVWLMGASEITDWRQLIDYLLSKMEPLCHIPFAVYGHSMGGIVAYETLIELEQRFRLTPTVFMPSSVSPPGIFERLKFLPPMYEIDGNMDMHKCRDILQKSQIILPLKSGIKPMSDEAIRCDLELIRSYRHRRDGPQLSCRILALQANNDILVKDPVSVSLWKNYSKGDFGLQEVEGSHLYFMNPPQSVFTTIHSFLQKQTEIAKTPFQPAIYRLISFESGTEDVHVYPYGIHPEGYLIYQQGGAMAAHIWSSLRRKAVMNEQAENNVTEQLLTYLAYTGYFHENHGVIEHSVCASSDPNFDNDCLTRYYDIQGNKIILTTAPFTTKGLRQSKSSGYCKLVWEKVNDDAKYSGHRIVGSWPLSSYKEDGESVLEGSPEGLLIMTAQGYFSIVAVKRKRNRPHYDNLILASDEEIKQAAGSCRSYCGRFEIVDENSIVFSIDDGSFDLKAKQITMRFGSLLHNGFVLQWLINDSEPLQVHVELKRPEQNGLAPSVDS